MATFNGHSEIVKLLKSAGASELMHAARENNVEMVKALLNKGANANAVTDENNTPLMVAARYGYTEVVRALVEKGADINVQNNAGKTALTIAEGQDHADIVRILRRVMDQG